MQDFKFNITCQDPEASVEVSPLPSENSISLFRISIRFPRKKAPATVRIEWEGEMRNILNVWAPSCGVQHAIRQWFAPTVCHSSFHSGAPLLCVIGDQNHNSSTISLSDPVTPLDVSFWIKDLEQRNMVGYAVTLFSSVTDALSEYETLLRIDCRKIPYYQSIRDVYPWWERCGCSIPNPPTAAEEPLYSSWYNFHQAPNGKKLLEELKIASELGFRTVILDDGWQFPGPSCGDYSFCGEWQVSKDKFEDFRTFTKTVHEYGMKLIVWFTVPFVGVKSSLFEHFKGRYLSVKYNLYQAGVLDVRYPEIRQWIVGVYRKFLTDYDIDGFKFDFIDSFQESPETAPYDPSSMDCESVGEAVRKLMTEITDDLGAIKQGLLYEYRQNYVGPAVNQFGNMLRVADCAYDAMTNRIGTVDLRLLNYPVAVHSDMLFWAPSESPVLCAKQLLSIMFSVPQISVLLTESTEEQRDLIRAFLAYWKENRETLLHGAFIPLHPELNYPIITAKGEAKQITVLYGGRSFRIGDFPCDIFADQSAEGIYIENASTKGRTVELFDRFGSVFLGTEELTPLSIQKITFPRTGMIRIL